mmetsp:Transcript_10248/g.13362  ORF Transcript_10248/g.13362 Transcript_10248/m.13362 type:complete len:215 (-) Transcript_10248:246-890(-)
MAHNRGRGTLEVRESANPFFVTNSSNYGLSADKFYSKQFDAPAVHRPHVDKQNADDQKPDFSFLYQKESERIGAKINHSDSKLSQALLMKESLGETAKFRSRGVNKNQPDFSEEHKAIIEADSQLSRPGRKNRDEVEQHLAKYNHQARPQNPLYTTANNQYGLKEPTAATFTAERQSKIQKFSTGFNGMVYRDQGLNTSIIKSRVHKKMDPQFL